MHTVPMQKQLYQLVTVIHER